jgi:hypothetical protein
MASIIAHRVLSDLLTIAQSNASDFDRQRRIARRVAQFRSDIARSRHDAEVIHAIVEKGRSGLEVAASSRALRVEQQAALVMALQTLRRAAKRKTVAVGD